jgi:hypothetical protein
MRAAVVGLALVALAAAQGARAAEPYQSPDGNYKVRFPKEPKVTTQTPRTDVGALQVTVATYATSDGNVYMVSFTDFPATAAKPENHASLFAGVIEGVKGTGKVAGEIKETPFGPDKLPAREFVVDKGKQRVRVRVILSGVRLYQVAAVGTADFATGKDATLFFDSFELTK